MEEEADFGSRDLADSVLGRRRSTSFTDDYSVQRTNDDASQSKYAAVQMGYWKDEFLKCFAYGAAGERPHRDPEINIGYWARIAGIRYYVDEFLSKYGDKGQIINLGCGFDTLYWRLKSEKVPFKRFVEVDFSSVTAKKIRQIRKPGSKILTDLFSQPLRESQHSDLHAGDYHLIGADARQWGELSAKLAAAELDHDAPTLVIAECVLVYMSMDQSLLLLNNLRNLFSTIFFVLNEMVNTHDEFGKVMVDNLAGRGLQLPGLPATESISTQTKRFIEAGFVHGLVHDMNEVYKKLLPAEEVRRVEAIECLDEMELLRQLNAHYCLAVAVADKGGEAARLGFPAFK